MGRPYPWEGKESPRESYVRSDSVGWIGFGVVYMLVAWLTKIASPQYGLLFIAYGMGYWAGVGAAFRRVEQG